MSNTIDTRFQDAICPYCESTYRITYEFSDEKIIGLLEERIKANELMLKMATNHTIKSMKEDVLTELQRLLDTLKQGE